MARLWQYRSIRIVAIAAACCLIGFGALRQVWIDYDPYQSWKIVQLYFTPVSQYTPQDVIYMTENLDQPPQWGGLKDRLAAALNAPQRRANVLANYPGAYQRAINQGYHLLQPPVLTIRSVKAISPTEDVVTYQTVGVWTDTANAQRAVRETVEQAVTVERTTDGWKFVVAKMLSDHPVWAH